MVVMKHLEVRQYSMMESIQCVTWWGLSLRLFRCQCSDTGTSGGVLAPVFLVLTARNVASTT
eukprot:1524151-Amphidinium_carterae.2